MKRSFLLGILCLLTASIFSQIAGAKSLSLIREDKSIIRYYLEQADKVKPSDDLLLVIQGSDCNSVQNIKSVNKLWNIWPSADLLTVEKYGITPDLAYNDAVERPDCPESYILHDNPEQRVSDIEIVMANLRYKYKKIIVIGGSEGSLIAAMLSSKVDYIDSTILFGSGGRWFIDDVIHSIQIGPGTLEGKNQNIEGFKQFAQHILSSEPFSLSMSNHGYSWWRFMLSIDHQNLIQKISNPVLILQGGEDKSASPLKTSEMVDDLRKNGKRNIDYYYYAKLNHSLGLSSRGNEADRMIADINNWLRKTIKKRPIQLQK